jgi:spore maturation protein CgeB
LDTSFLGKWGPRWFGACERRLFVGPTFYQANSRLIDMADKIRPDIIWIDKGIWVWPTTIKTLREKRFYLVHHNTDDLWAPHVGWQYLLMRLTIRDYDIHFTIHDHNVIKLRASGARRVERTCLGYDHSRFNASALSEEERARWEHGVLFIGHWEPETEAGVRALVMAGLPIVVYGSGWERAAKNPKVAPALKLRSLRRDDYVKALKSTRIGLCFVSKWNQNQTAGRSFEIPACGTFLLAERTDEHIRLYREGIEAEFFGDTEELIQKVRFYLAHDFERREIAQRGYERCIGSGYSWQDSMRGEWGKVLEACRNRDSILASEDNSSSLFVEL